MGGDRTDPVRFGIGRRGLALLAGVALLIVGTLSFIRIRAEDRATDELVERFRERAVLARNFVATAFAQSTARS